MRRILSLGLLATLAAAPTQAAWQAFSAGSAPALMAAGAAEQFTIEVEVPGLEVAVRGPYSHLSIPGHALTQRRGEPELPVLTTSILLPDQGRARVELEVLGERTVALEKPVVPSFGQVTRAVPFSTLKRFEGPVYQAGQAYPAEGYAVQMDTPFILRDVRGAALRVSPVVYDVAQGTLRVLTRARLHVTVEAGMVGLNERTGPAPSASRDFLELYRSLFVNAELAGWTDADLSEDAGRAVIVCPDEWVPNLEPLLAWRRTKGLPTKVLPTSQTGTSGAQVKAALQAEFDAGGLTYVLLVGDADQIQPLEGDNESADCDSCMVMLAGNDYVPDVFISRFSAQTAEQVDVQVARAVKYEQEPVLDGAFYRKATGIASNEGTPKDYERMNILWDALKGFRMDEVDRLYDPDRNNWPGLQPVKPEQVAAAINQGRSVINYMGHGSKTEWVTSGFGVSHIQDQLTNSDGQWPMIWSVACVNGDFRYGDACFGEAWARAGTAEAPKGAIGIVAASTNMAWHPPVTWQANVIKEYMIPGKVFTGGALHHYSLVKAMEQWGSASNSDGVQMIEQCIFFGDSSVVLRNDLPHQASVATAQAAAGERAWKVAVGDHPCKGARVVLRAGDQEWVRVAGADGVVSFPATAAEAAGATLTITGPNLIPVIDQAL